MFKPLDPQNLPKGICLVKLNEQAPYLNTKNFIVVSFDKIWKSYNGKSYVHLEREYAYSSIAIFIDTIEYYMELDNA
jgi:hypothetical protein